MLIPQNILEQMVAHARQEAPIEACGYLIGKNGRITQCYPVRNDDQAEDHFTFTPEEQHLALLTAEREGLEIMALYHSHPRGAARPSAEDLRLAFDPSLLYVIISLVDRKDSVRAFHIREGKIEEEQVVVGTSE